MRAATLSSLASRPVACRRAAVLAVVGAFALTVAACSSSPSSTATTTAGTTATTGAPAGGGGSNAPQFQRAVVADPGG